MEYLNTKILNYRLTRFIGEGGMASVYEGTHEKLGTKVAIKILNPVLTANKQIRQRFENEAKMMASLDHPNIVRVLDYDEQPDKLSIIMDLLDGQDLNTLIKAKGAMKPDQAIPLFTQVLDAFSYAHDKGIIHRDIKPSNIFLDSKNGVKILDFGIAKIFQAGENYTLTGTQLGTPTYMSPEQVDADKSIDYRSDIYSLGATLFFILSGTPPYDSSTLSTFKIYNKIVYEPFPALVGYQDFDDIIKIAVAKDRNQRFPDAKAFKQALLNPVHKTTPVIDDATKVDTPKTEKPKQKPAPVDDDKTWIDAPGAIPPKTSSTQDDETLIDKPVKPERTKEENKKQNFEELLKKADQLFKNRQFGQAKKAYENVLLLNKEYEHAKSQLKICKTELAKKNKKTGLFAAIGVVVIVLVIFIFNIKRDTSSVTINENLRQDSIRRADSLMVVANYEKEQRSQDSILKAQNAENQNKIASENDDIAWNNAKKAGTIEAYRTYARENPMGKYRKEAKYAIDDLAQKPVFSFEYPMVFVQGGTFQMGRNDGFDDEKPVHTVNLDGFYIGMYEVTQAQWREIMGASDSLSDPSNFKNCDNCPVEQVSWNDVQEFIKKLNQKTGKNYRLPTEAEWEYAAKGGASTSSATTSGADRGMMSEVESSLNADFDFAGSNNIDEVAWYDGNSGNKTHPIGQKKPNSLDIYDMSGNVWEWCNDWYGNYSNGSQTNPQGPSSGSGRVFRGGGWKYVPQYCRVAFRIDYSPDFRYFVVGLRLSRMQ